MTQNDIRAALSSDDRAKVQAAIEAAKQAAPELEARAATLQAESLNPALTDSQAGKARSDYDAARFQAERMNAALQALIERDAALESAEAEAKRREQYDDAAAMLEAAQKRHSAEWDAHALALAGIVREIEAAKMAVARANDDLPADALRLALPGPLMEIRTTAKRLRTSDGARLLADWPQSDGGPGCVALEILEGGKAA